MKLPKVGLTILLTVLTTLGAIPLIAPRPLGVKSAVAQSDRKIEAYKLFQQGMRQYQNGEAESLLSKETIASKNYRQEDNAARGFLLIIILAAIGASIYFVFLSNKQPSCNRLRKQLLVLVKNQEDVADRLINHAKLRYPGHPEHWYYEKVIYDLKRGR